MALYHAHRDTEFLGNLLERAFILGHGYEHVDFARGESVVGDEGLALLLDGGGGECLFCQLLALALLLGLGQAEQARGYKRRAGGDEQNERTDHNEGNVIRGHESKRDARCGESAYIVGGAAHASPKGGRMHVRCQLCKGGGKERDEKARAQVKDDKA